MIEDILRAAMYLAVIYVLIHLLLLVIRFFKELFEETWQVWVGIATIFVLSISIQQLYVFNDLLGVIAFVLVFLILIYFLHKKIGIIKFLKIFTGIDEYNKEDTFWKKFFKILQISFTTIVFTAIALGMFIVLIEMIFLNT